MKKIAPLSFVAILLLSACASGSADRDATPEATAVATGEDTESVSPATTQSEAAEPENSPEAQEASGDVTSDLTSSLSSDLASLVVSAEETEPGRIEVSTSIVDPRGDDGSAEAQSAIAICEAATGLDGVTYVSVLEDDGTTFVLYGHPMVPEGECGEV